MTTAADAQWDWFQAEAARLGAPVSDAQRDRFVRYHARLVATNAHTNLTRILDLRDALLKHYMDSLLFLALVPDDWHDREIRFFDMGAGGGIPGIPLLIMRPHWRALLVDAVGKKAAFMAEAMADLGLTGGEARHARAEDLGHDPALREGFDLGVARAVAAMPELLELTLPLVRPGGRLVLSKGSRGPEELRSAEKALSALGGVVAETVRRELPEGAGERHLYAIGKQRKTPRDYPRKAGIPHRKPIC